MKHGGKVSHVKVLNATVIKIPPKEIGLNYPIVGSAVL